MPNLGISFIRVIFGNNFNQWVTQVYRHVLPIWKKTGT